MREVRNLEVEERAAVARPAAAHAGPAQASLQDPFVETKEMLGGLIESSNAQGPRAEAR